MTVQPRSIEPVSGEPGQVTIAIDCDLAELGELLSSTAEGMAWPLPWRAALAKLFGAEVPTRICRGCECNVAHRASAQRCNPCKLEYHRRSARERQAARKANNQ